MRPSSQGSRSTSRLDFGFDFERTDERAARVQEEGELQIFFFFSSTFDSVTIWCRCSQATDCPEKTREIEKSPFLDEWITNVCDKHLYFVREVRKTKLKIFNSECFFFFGKKFDFFLNAGKNWKSTFRPKPVTWPDVRPPKSLGFTSRSRKSRLSPKKNWEARNRILKIN